ncbi:DUF2797 domain-containing protein [Natronobacterium gregoryi]|uniref:DUF2797 domain-containing protein n=2 Tax=Natronobacterium gregoryi TaxID=44930 RepID=L0AG20_NATGS|nr:DUF2797 domain-containing protein [Natronobacterium gregoryi]AFZ72087.1 Protein of unknown function (DUF2797) [Natronobacterium gregoryi SP2]ELY62739.1 hypothetical protein C490_17027 [Natronobacterium gregoryi SP2]PLK20061.1 DUF2797 domain-containing protein [Natronobacterium gregoryi SP2]SFJ44239.1 Protein of unknown function [Natronobacterium gregoryi]
METAPEPERVQLVGYEPSGRGSALLLGDGGSVERRDLEPGDVLSYSLGERRCAGAIGDGEHVACDRSGTPYCEFHTSTWVCARCTGTCLKPEMDCHEPHAVYVAAFAPDTFKIGVTREWRLETRLREQGADRAVRLYTVSDGRIAREIEAEIARRLTDRVRTGPKVAALASDVDETAWEETLADLEGFVADADLEFEFEFEFEFDPAAEDLECGVRDRYAFDYGIDLETRPVRETVASGTVVGVKGRLLVLENGGTTYAVDMRDLVGYELDDGTTDRNLQSSLGSFG